MTTFFAVEDQPDHHVGDGGCPACSEQYPQPCACGGLMHGVVTDDPQAGTAWTATRCDQCGRSLDDVEEELGREPAG
jgi:hypothetical protein